MSRTVRMVVLLGVVLVCGGCDQGTKELAREALRSGPTIALLGGAIQLEYAENPGAFLSTGAVLPEAYRSGIFVLGVGVMLAVLLGLALFKKRMGTLELLSLALALAGGLSNWVDRVWRGGRVVDFMTLSVGPLHTGIFNVADVAIMAGVALLGVQMWRGRSRDLRAA